jgi:CHRD domain-containing protein
MKTRTARRCRFHVERLEERTTPSGGLLTGMATFAMQHPAGEVMAQRVRQTRIFQVSLRGTQEVPPHTTRAKGQGMFTLSKDGLSLQFQITVMNISNVTAAHIHLGPPGVSGPIVAHLAGDFAPGGGLVRKQTFRGRLTAANLVGPLAAHALADLITAMRASGAYVNVHTNDGAPPPDSGPGDFPAGEIRGQIRPTGR